MTSFRSRFHCLFLTLGAACLCIGSASAAPFAYVPNEKSGIGFTPDGSQAYVANGRSDSVSVIDTAGAAKVADIPVGRLPWDVVIR